MSPRISTCRRRGFTLVEAIVIVVFVAVLICLIVPALAHPHLMSARISCVNNLKQIGTAFRIWEEDHGHAYPMEVMAKSGGSQEFDFTPEVFPHFQAMQNELGLSPKILVCPVDKSRRPAANFDSFNNSNISYFVGVGISATNTNPNLFLSGDRNLGAPGLVLLTTNDSAGWTIGIHGDAKSPAGNMLFSDGSAQMMGTPGLRRALQTPGVAPAALAIP